MKLDTACVGLGCLRSCQTLTVLRGRKKEGGMPGAGLPWRHKGLSSLWNCFFISELGPWCPFKPSMCLTSAQCLVLYK